ncbi:RuBisCO large subunit-binding protein subunit alpha [Tanacetum coccineum]
MCTTVLTLAGTVPGRGAAFVHLSTLAPGVEGEVVVDKVKESEWEFGCNAMTDKYENLVESGVIDPAKVTRCALQNAIVVEKAQPKTPAAAGAQQGAFLYD